MSSDECDPFTRGHVVEVCRERCAEVSLGGKDFAECVRSCVEELRSRCGS
ncbi:hypothetical protein ASAC_0763 [Acidilobus saccharovorans 345-15]|uniref:Uncharacterized protein n=1 Tax=Acidilobus saccharovorans (strain DSM 16705 / JCM 18335 / VKM B-2471 / 345-15) TaxID=666510 RepID=D9Q1I1_ACIS3|nr:hypothetical protein [Acidilobus saccharovorans]ADL19169.1 hypothetical protein ASAC_0763 [Acidilobus saccharovorans 345-15]